MGRSKPGIDIRGNEYTVGDEIAAAINYYGPALVVGEVLAIEDRRIKIRPTARSNWASDEGRGSWISPERIVKLGAA